MIKYFFILFLFCRLFSSEVINLNHEVYQLEKENILLYKIINWWNIDTQEGNTDFCYKNIKVRTKNLKISYDKINQNLTISTKNNFPRNIKIDINRVENIYSNKDYFSKTNLKRIESINKLVFKDISEKQYNMLISIKNDLVIQIEGKIHGVLAYSSKISLTPEGDFIRKCPKTTFSNQSIFIKFINIKKDKILATYKIEN